MTDELHSLIVSTGPGRVERSTTTLLESLVARLTTLTVVSGADAVGSLMAGFAALGREASQTAEGARIWEALSAGRTATNIAMLWSRLGIDAAVSRMPPTPVLSDLRNDVALLVAPDLAAGLDQVEARASDASIGPVRSPEPVNPIEVLVGLWAFGGELSGAVEILASPTMPERVAEHTATPDPAGGPVLR